MRSPYLKVCLGPSAPVTKRNSPLGGVVVGDYISPEDNQRYLLVETAARKPKAPAKKKAKVEEKGDLVTV